MSNPQVTMSGTATLRDWADKIENWNWRPGQLLGPVALRQMAANWDADLNHAVGLIADATLRAERAEAALERERSELTSVCMSVSRMTARALEQELRANNLQAALERARALLKRIEWRGGYIYGSSVCPDCGMPSDRGHEPVCQLAAALKGDSPNG